MLCRVWLQDWYWRWLGQIDRVRAGDLQSFSSHLCYILLTYCIILNKNEEFLKVHCIVPLHLDFFSSEYTPCAVCSGSFPCDDDVIGSEFSLLQIRTALRSVCTYGQDVLSLYCTLTYPTFKCSLDFDRTLPDIHYISVNIFSLQSHILLLYYAVYLWIDRALPYLATGNNHCTVQQQKS